MLFQGENAGNAVGRRPRRTASPFVTLLLAAAMVQGCANLGPAVSVWKSSEAYEEVTQFGPERESGGSQWFARVIDPAAIPPECRHPLSERFDFVLVTNRGQWSRLIAATTLDSRAQPPSFFQGPVAGILCRTGEAPEHRWPIIIRSARSRRGVVLLHAQYREGFYRPLLVPPYLHLVSLPGATSIIGLKLNGLLFGFNVEISELHEAGIR